MFTCLLGCRIIFICVGAYLIFRFNFMFGSHFVFYANYMCSLPAHSRPASRAVYERVSSWGWRHRTSSPCAVRWLLDSQSDWRTLSWFPVTVASQSPPYNDLQTTTSWQLNHSDSSSFWLQKKRSTSTNHSTNQPINQPISPL